MNHKSDSSNWGRSKATCYGARIADPGSRFPACRDPGKKHSAKGLLRLHGTAPAIPHKGSTSMPLHTCFSLLII